jgi:hypothetical protein
MPLLRDLIEPHIKSKREFLLPWRYSLLFTPTAATGFHQSLQHPSAPMALGGSLGVMAILLTKSLITLGASLQV